jgi:hypothetical protein
MTATAKAGEKAAKTKRGTIVIPTLPDILPAFLLPHIPGEIGSVQDIHAPFDQFDDGDPNRDGENKKQNELDDHVSDP